jgi:hypothetical protein
MFRVGDIVVTTLAIRNNPVVCESRGYEPINRGSKGVIVGVHQTELNKAWKKSGIGDVYVDVHIFNDGTGKPWIAGNYHSGSFSKIV